MKRSLSILCASLLAGARWAAADPSDAETEAHKVALDVAGAFSNDGFKIRDGRWVGALQWKKPVLLQVNLYAGNRYWFSVGATSPAKKLAVTVFDEKGQPVSGDLYNDAAKAACGIEPKVSGPYFVRVEALEGEPATFCLIYSYQ